MFIPFIILFSITGILCNPFDCVMKEGKICGEFPFLKSYPESAEELRTACNNFGIYGRCLVNVYESCEHNDEILKEMRRIVGVVNSACDEDSPAYKVISSNIECIGPVAKKVDYACNKWKMSEENFELAAKHEMEISNNYTREDTVISSNIECVGPVARKVDDTCNQWEMSEENFELAAKHEMEISNNYTREDMEGCLTPFWQVSCGSIVMGLRCGAEVKEVVHDFLAEIDVRYEKCTNEILEELQPLYETYEFIIEAELKLKNALKKRK